MHVTTLLIGHHGAPWRSAVLDGVVAQTRAADRQVAVDTSSHDDPLAPGPGWDLVRTPAASFDAAVRAGLAQQPAVDDSPEDQWVWILHDDGAPAPTALAELTAAAQRHPEAHVFGPKLRGWPASRRLLELGVTLSGTGRRETGLERREHDQGQHDRRRVVLAVNTAGMLVRRDVLDRLGFDPELPWLGTDVDFGWRAARAGHRSLVVPEAVVFHAEATARGRRDAEASRRRHRDARAAAIYTLLVNGSGRGLPFRAVRLLLGSLLRALGLLLVRAPGEAGDQVAAVASVLGRPGRVRRGRVHRRATNRLGPGAVRDLLPPWWLPYRHGLDTLGEVGGALLSLGRRHAARGSVGAFELTSDQDAAREQPSLAGLLARNPLVWLVVGSTALALVAARGQLGDAVAGGALLPAPETAAAWWRSYLADHHLLGAGTSAPAAAYLLPLAVAGTLLLGHAPLLVALLFLGSVPLTTLSALRFLRRVVPGRAAPMWGALGYGLLPVAAGAVIQGRLGTVVGALLLPWVATSALGLMSDDADRRWRAGWLTALGSGALSAFVPWFWGLTLVLAVVVLAGGRASDGARWRQRSWFGPVLAATLPVPLLLLPWLAGPGGRLSAWLVEAGRADVEAGPRSWLDLLAGRVGDGGAPVWLGLLLAATAVLALARGDVRGRVLLGWGFAAVAAGWLLLLVNLPVALPGLPSVTRGHPGFAVLLVHAGLLVAAVLGADGLRSYVDRSRGAWRPALAGLAVAAGLVGVVGTTAWWVATGVGGPGRADVPAYMSELAATRNTSAVLVLRGGDGGDVRYQLLRRGRSVVGDDAILARTVPDPRLTATVGSLLADPGGDGVERLSRYGVRYVVAPGPVSAAVSGGLDATTELSRASATDQRSGAWRLQRPTTLADVALDPAPAHRWLVALQLLAIVALVVLAAPGRRTDQDPEEEGA